MQTFIYIFTFNHSWKKKLQRISSKNKGPVTNAKNINAESPKILTPTHFWRTKDIKAKKLGVGAIPWIFFFAIGVFGVNILHTDFVENKAEYLKADKVT